MSKNFLDHIWEVEDHRIVGMTTYPLDEVLLTVLIGLLCRGEDFDEIEIICTEHLSWLRRFLPFCNGIAPAQTLRRVLQALNPVALERAFSSWVASLQEKVSGIVAIDGKTLRGSKHDKSGADALHLVSAYAHASGLVLAHRAVASKSNEITAIPELLDMLEIEGAIVTIDAIGTQKSIAARIIGQKGDYLLALKENQETLHTDVAEFFADPFLAAQGRCETQISSGHGRIEERVCLVADAAWLAERHPQWKGLCSIAQLTATRIDKKTGESSSETRFYISSLPPDPASVLTASQAHWSIENNLHWQLDVTFREDACRTRKDHAAHNLATLRKTVLNLLKREPSKISLKRKRLKAALNPNFRDAIFVVNDL
jgi:predicted transposase YbfD/YdcC